MRLNYISLSGILFMFLISSCCNNIYYVNDPVPFATVKRKSDWNLSGGLNYGHLTKGLHGNFTIAVTDNLFILGSYSNYFGDCKSRQTFNGVTTTQSISYFGRSILPGIGYYKSLGDDFYFECITGAKYGINQNKNSIEEFEFRHIKYFLQPGVTFQKEIFQAGFAFRMGFIDYLNYKTGKQNTVPEIARNKIIPYLDPAFFLAIGSNNFKFGAQISMTVSQNTDINYYVFGSLFGLIHEDPLSLSIFLKIAVPSNLPQKENSSVSY